MNPQIRAEYAGGRLSSPPTHDLGVSLTQRVQGGEPRVVDHQIGAFGERAIACIAADAALSGRPRARTVDDAVAGLAQLGRELFGEGDIAMSDEDGAHDSLSFALSLAPSCACRHARWGGLRYPSGWACASP